jgi:hypothetical protein
MIRDMNMNGLIDVRGMNVGEYCSFIESRALHLGVTPFELNILNVEKGLISWDRFEAAKVELLARRMNDNLIEI